MMLFKNRLLHINEIKLIILIYYYNENITTNKIKEKLFMKIRRISFLIVMVLSITTLVSCARNSTENQNSINKVEDSQQVVDNTNKINNTNKPDSTNNIKEDKNSETKTEKNQQVNNTNEATSKKDNVQENTTVNKTQKIKGRKQEFLNKLDSIQKELDNSPEKKEADTGVTLAMRSYAQKEYDMYDKELNDIYGLLKKELSPEVMKSLQAEEVEWIEQKEAKAKKEASQYEGGTLAPVVYISSLYESTKQRCYDLVNNYMTD